VYHPDQGHAFSTVTFAGFIGTITGFSSVPIGISEKVWLDYKGQQNRFGYPFHFLLRDFLQFDNTTDDVINRIQRTVRTCSIWIGVGSPMDNFKIIQYSYEGFNILNDRNYPPYKNHPNYKNLVYVDKHVQPSGDNCLGDTLGKDHGNINALSLITNTTALHQTGDTHIAIYDFARLEMYVAFAGVYDPKTKSCIPAYNRRFTKLNMDKLFKEQI